MEGPELCPRITSRTITRACSFARPPRSFSRSALLFRVIPANIAVDLNQKEKRLHFDNSTFSAGVEHINELWSRIEAGVARMTNFGRLTHTVQDFYSHSNWVELHQHLSPDPGLGPERRFAAGGGAQRDLSEPAAAAPGALPTHAELNKDCPFAWFSPSGARVVADGPNRGKTPL